MAYTTIDKPTDYFNTVLYVGNGTAIGSGGKTVTGVGFQPDFVWGKARSGTDAVDNHELTDAVRGATKYLKCNNTSAEITDTESLTSFTSDGFTLGSNGQLNRNGNNCVAWNWKAGGSSTTTPTGGTIATTVSANTTAGFSIFTYTGNGNAAQLAHGLGVAPDVVLIKGRTNTDNWFMKHKSLNANQYIYLNDTGDVTSGANVWSNTNPDATKIYVGTDGGVNGNGTPYIAYAFAEKTGYSKFGSFTGTGNADGPFIYTGFKPAFVIVKITSTSNNWNMFDDKRPGFNEITLRLFPNLNNAEQDGSAAVDFVSNGFKFRNTNDNYNASGASYIYMAFAGEPLVANSGSNGVPATAR